VAGEACATPLVANHYDRLPSTKLYNEYGPSEACVWASVARLQDSDRYNGITIGRPIANTQLYVLDEQKRLLPKGVPGELYIGGDNVSPGYLGHEELSRKAFIDNPFVDDGSMLYKTGDRVRLLDDGRVAYIGRVDHQIKVRGFRVEPGEIEATIAEHPAVDAAIVLLDTSASMDAEIDALIYDIDEPTLAALLSELNSTNVHGIPLPTIRTNDRGES
jgi:non-ribosomal peptide synthetase component F